jgi:hypothetical protein
LVPKEFPPYISDVILRPWDEEVDEDEVPWRPHPVVFSLRTDEEMSAEELAELRAKLEKKLHKKSNKKDKHAPPDEEGDEEDGPDIPFSGSSHRHPLQPRRNDRPAPLKENQQLRQPCLLEYGLYRQGECSDLEDLSPLWQPAQLG